MRYTGETCPICHAVFTEDDDIVVCPDCGTPHHRKCYLQNKTCAYAERHTDGFAWAPAERTQDADTHIPPTNTGADQRPPDDGHRILFCPQCGAQNAAEEPVCTQCGARLYNMQNQPYTPQIQLPDMTARPYFVKGAVIPPTETIDGNTVGDTAEYIQSNAARYIPKFYKMEKTGGKVSWNWAAFFFSPYWFFYRKLYAAGAVLMALLLVTAGATCTPRFMEKSDALYEINTQYREGKLSDEAYVEAGLEASVALLSLPESKIRFAVSALAPLVSGLFANYLYKKKTGREIQRLREKCRTPEEYRFMLFRRGGMSMLMCFASVWIYILASQVISIAISGLLM